MIGTNVLVAHHFIIKRRGDYHSLPSEQHYTENSYGLVDNTMVAVTHNVHDAFLKFKFDFEIFVEYDAINRKSSKVGKIRNYAERFRYSKPLHDPA